MYNQSNSNNNLIDNVRNIIYEIEEKAVHGDYIYRGEPEHHEESPYYGKICSSLYRQYARIEADEFDIESVQGEILEEAKAYSPETDDPVEILTQLQHYGGKTNLIDFTTDHFIALFFACDRSSSLKEDGRLILLNKGEKYKDQILYPRNPRNRVIAQKSVFVRHPDGFLSPDEVEVITIPSEMKQPILTHLRKYHDISTESIYNDLHGFIINQHFHESAYQEFHRGLTYQLRGYETDILEEEQSAYEKAIVHYSRALKLKQDIPDAFINRGVSYLALGEFSLALTDFDKAIELNPDNADTYIIRSDAYLGNDDIHLAMEDCKKAIELKPNDADMYIYRGNTYLNQDNVKFALSDFNKAIKLKPDYTDAYIIRGVAYRRQDEFQLAIKDLNKAIELNSENANAYVIRGDAYFGKEEYESALVDYNKAVELNPDDSQAYYNIGVVWMLKQDWQEAKLNFTIAGILKMDIKAEFYETYKSVEIFEKDHSINIPKDIASMLIPES